MTPLNHPRYRIVKALGSGAFSTVYLAFDTWQNDVPVAMKHITATALPSGARNLAIAEFCTLSHIRHPNIIPLLDYGIFPKDNSLYLIFQYAAGNTLEHYIQSNQPMTVKDLTHIAVDLCRGLELLHCRNITHHDLKPANIMVTCDKAMLMDFGLAILGYSSCSSIRGTIQYMAPELLSAKHDHRIDIFGLGACLFEAATGESLFQMAQSHEILAVLRDATAYTEMRDSRLQLLEGNPLQCVITRCLAFKPEQRYASCAEIIDALNRSGGGKHPVETGQTALAYLQSVFPYGLDAHIRHIQNMFPSARSALEPAASFVLIVGRAGTGKTLLFDELQARYRIQGVPILRVDCAAFMPGLFACLLPLLDQVLTLVPDVSFIEPYGPLLKRILPHHPLLAGFLTQAVHDAKTERKRVITAVAQVILELSSRTEQPVFLLENVNDIDDATAAVIERVITSTHLPLLPLIIASARPPLSDRLSAWTSRIEKKGTCTQIMLQELSGSDIHRFLTSVFGYGRLSAQCKDHLYDLTKRAGGNQRYFVEMLRYLVADGVISRRGLQWTTENIPLPRKVPHSLVGMVSSGMNLQQLEESTKHILLLLALAARPLGLQELIAMDQASRKADAKVTNAETVHEILSECVAKRVLTIKLLRNTVCYAFSHDLLSEIMAEKVTDAPAYHLAIAAGLASVHGGNIDPYYYELAEHYAAARKPLKAQANYAAAGRYYSHIFSFARARDAYSRALELLGKGNSAKRLDLSNSLIEVLMHLGEWRDAHTILAEALHAAEALQDPKQILSVLLLQVRNHIDEGAYEPAKALLDTIGRYPELTQYPLKQGVFFRHLGQYYWHIGQFDEALTYYSKQSAIAHAHDSPSLAASAAGNIGLIHWRRGEYDEALKHYEIMRSIADKIGDRKKLGDAFGNIGLIHWAQGKLEKAKNMFEQKLAVAEEIGDKQAIAIALTNLGNVCADSGAFNQALAHYHNQVDIVEYLGDKLQLSIGLGNIGTVYQDTGDYETALVYYQRKLALCREIGDKTDLSIAYCNLADIALLQERYAQSDGYYTKALTIARELQLDYYRSYYAFQAGVLFTRTKHTDKAEKLCREAITCAKKVGRSNIVFRATVLLHRLLYAKAQPQEREKHITALQALLATKERKTQEKAHVLATLYDMTANSVYGQQARALFTTLLQNRPLAAFTREYERLSERLMAQKLSVPTAPAHVLHSLLATLEQQHSELPHAVKEMLPAAQQAMKNIAKNSRHYADDELMTTVVSVLENNASLEDQVGSCVEIIYEQVQVDVVAAYLYDNTGTLKNVATKSAISRFPTDDSILRKHLAQACATGCMACTDEDIPNGGEMERFSLLVLPIGRLAVNHIGNNTETKHLSRAERVLGVLVLGTRTTALSRNYLESLTSRMKKLADLLSRHLMVPFFYEQAYRDRITGLLFRPFFERRISRELALAQQNDEPVWLLVIDIDNFSTINREHGETFGNRILKETTCLLKRFFPYHDVCSRIGADIFACMPPALTKDAVLSVAQRIINAFSDDQDELQGITVHIGVSSSTDLTNRYTGLAAAQELITAAILALERAKQLDLPERFALCKPSEYKNYQVQIMQRSIITGNPLKDYRNIGSLMQAIVAANATLELQPLFARVLDMILKITDAERGILMLRETAAEQLVVKAARAGDGATLGETLEYSRSIPAKVYETGHPVCMKDVISEDLPSLSVMDLELKSVMCIPLELKDERIGVLYVDSRSALRTFSESELAFFYAMSRQLAGVIENARLHTETVAMAQEIQQYNTELINREQQLLSSYKVIEDLQVYLSNILDSMPSLLISVDTNGNVTRMNKAAADFFQQERQAICGKPLFKQLPFLQAYESSFQQILTECRPLEFHRESYRDDDRRLRYLDIAWFPLFNKTLTGAVLRIDDVTAYAAQEKQLRQAQKMEVIGTLAGGLAHDFNNIISGITGILSLISYKLDRQVSLENNVLRDYVETMMNAAHQAANLAGQLLVLSRRHDVSYVPIELNKRLKDIEKLLSKTLDPRIELDLQYANQDAVILADPSQIEQMLLNLCVNAAHAMTIMRTDAGKEGGVLTIGLERILLDERFCKTREQANPGWHWNLMVSDTGVGIAAEHLESVFDPFFTTKKAESGTGLGLAMVRSIVQQHKAFIDLFSQVGHGTTFNVYFPEHKTQGKDILADERHKIINGTGQVLVVESKPLIRGVVESMLQELGYSVKAVNNAEQAFEVLSASSPDCILLDIFLPRIAPENVIKRLDKCAPDIRVVLTSGFPKNETIEKLIESRAYAFLRKPFTLRQLSEVVYRTMHALRH